MWDYKLIKSKRKTLSLEVRPDGLVVRAPNRITRREADAFVTKHADWIRKKQAQIAERSAQAQTAPALNASELEALARQAAVYIPARVRFYAERMDAHYGRITIRCQKTRWGSCSAKKNLNFNLLLMLTPPEVIDSVVVHELCHLWEMNHGPRFYERVYAAYPEYDRWNRWLKEHGAAIMARAH